MTTRPLWSSALLTIAFGCLMLAASCATPTSTPPTNNCSAGQMDCSGQCKTVATDNQNCGACGTACGANKTCSNGMCQCVTGLFNCNGQCVGSDATHCGPSCTMCPSATPNCSSNTCMAMCPSGQTMCAGGACVPATGDGTIAHCGGCSACPAGADACNNGVCGCAVAGRMLCGSACVDTSNSNTHCGGCNIPCTGGTSCQGGQCMATTGTGGTTGAGGSAAGSAGTTGAGGSSAGRGGTTGTAGTGGGVSGTTGTGGRGGTTGSGGTGGVVGGNPAGWWTSGTMHGCPWTGIDTVSGTTTVNSPQAFTTKTDSFATPYCVSGTVHQAYESVALLGFNLNETPDGTADQCGYKPADGTKLGPAGITVTGSGIALNFSKKVGSVLRIQIQDPMGGLTSGGDTHRWCYTITDVQGPVFAPWNKFNTKCWDQTGTNFNPSTNTVSSIVFAVPGVLVPSRYDYCIGGFAFGNDVSAAPAYNPSPFPTVAGTLGGPGATDLDFQRVKVTPGGARPPSGKQYIIQNNNWGTPSGTDQTITYSGNTFTITSTTGNVTGQGVPASFPSIYVGNNGDTQNKNDPPKGSYSTQPSDGLPKAINAITSAMTTAAYNKTGGDFNATYDIWLAASNPTSAYSDALSGFVMVWLYKPGGRSPIGSVKATKTIDGTSYEIWAGPRGSGTDTQRPVISYVTSSMNKTFNLKPILDDAAANAATYGVRAIPASSVVTDIFFGFEVWTGSAAAGLGVTNFTVDVR